eukprot:TRINITY_DN13181_c0_g1_i1.p1 TRINITY_DN13181_c0_g1~~TRINITY_DN13181_c0_g1_i1.p1  ORF type:complete len:187 (-),score=30.86 TRINITY_DN13181_c0_g1_i1:21-581(-)
MATDPFAQLVSNDARVEEAWAATAFHHAETYFKLISTVSDPSALKLTQRDNEIYAEFRQRFPTLAVDNLNEEELKSPESKHAWRPFLMEYEGVVDKFNFATLLRLRSGEEYSQDNSTVVPRIQFLVIEIARNREGFNNKKVTRLTAPVATLSEAAQDASRLGAQVNASVRQSVNDQVSGSAPGAAI